MDGFHYPHYGKTTFLPYNRSTVMTRKKKNLFLLIFTILSAAYTCILLYGYFLKTDTGSAVQVIRWLAEAALLGYAFTKRTLSAWIFTAMLLGAEFGYLLPEVAANFKVLSGIFIKLIKTILAPLLFGTLVVGIAGHSDLKQVGRMGWKSLVYFEVITTVALFIGLGVGNLTQPGTGITQQPGAVVQIAEHAKVKTWDEIILHTFPENIAKSIADNNVLQVVIFSVLFGIGLAMVKGKPRETMLTFCEGLSEVMFKFTNIVMYFAPFAVFGAMASSLASLGTDVLWPMLKLILSVYGALVLLVVAVFIPVLLIFRIPIRKFVKHIAQPVNIAFGSASSEAALPRAMEEMEILGVPRKIVSFVMPTGLSFNLDGTTLYLSLATLFVAQAAGIPLLFSQQLIIVFTLMLTSKGVAGVARASLVILAGTVESFNLPMWPIAMIMAVDVLMDMARTAINITGNCLATCVIARWEGEFNDKGGNPHIEDIDVVKVR